MTKTRRKYIIAILCALVVLATSVLFAKYGRDLTMIKWTKTIRVVTDQDTINSFEYDLLKCYANHLGVKIKVTQANNFTQCLQIMDKHGADILIHLIPTTTQMKELFSCTYPIYKTQLMLIQNNKHIIKNLSELEDSTIYVEKNSPYLLRLNNLVKETGTKINIKEVNLTPEELFYKVNNGEISFTIGTEFQMHLLDSSLPNVDYSRMIGVRHFIAWGVPSTSLHLRSDIDEWLEQFTKTTEFRDIIRKYYH